MSTAPAANVRVLELFVELLGAQPGRTKAQLRALPGYRGLADDAFETQFQRDKDALRDAGVLLRIGRGEHYSIDRDSLAPDIEVGAADRALLSLAARAWDRGDVLAASVDAKAAASSEEEVSAPVIRLGLTGLEAATAFARGIRERRVVSFEYPGSGGLTQRAVEPWALTVQGRSRPQVRPRVSRRWCLRSCGCARAARRVRCSSGTRPWLRLLMSVLHGRAGSPWRWRMASWARGLPACCRWLSTLSWWAPRCFERRCWSVCARRPLGEVAMPENVSLAFVRLSSMVAWIAEHPGVHVDDIGAHFGRTRRQVRRDIEYLASVGDSLPGESFEVDWGLFEEEQRVSLRSTLGASAPLRLSEVEAQALLIGLSAIAPLLAPDVAAHLPHAALVVSALGGLGEAGGSGTIDASPASASSRIVEALRDALERRERVSFDYVSTRGQVSHRVVDPWSLEASATGWLLRGWCDTARAPRTFAVASISDVRVNGPRLQAPRRVRDDAPAWRLDVDRPARWIADEYGGTIVAELSEGGARIDVPVWNDDWGLSLLTDIAAHVRAVSPDRRAEAGARARSIIDVWTQEDQS